MLNWTIPHFKSICLGCCISSKVNSYEETGSGEFIDLFERLSGQGKEQDPPAVGSSRVL